MNTIIFTKKDLTDSALEKIAQLLLDSKIIAFPTETVYGLGAHALNERAINKIFDLKQRPKNKSLIVHLGKIQDVEKVACDIPSDFYTLAEKFFPGPLTIILKKKKEVPALVSNNDTIAVRMPDNIYTLKLINYLGFPIVGTSANISSQQSPAEAKQVLNYFNNKIEAILDTGPCKIKIPSTIINLVEKPYKIIRQGSIVLSQILEILKK